jgi:hypothetical protein
MTSLTACGPASGVGRISPVARAFNDRALESPSKVDQPRGGPVPVGQVAKRSSLPVDVGWASGQHGVVELAELVLRCVHGRHCAESRVARLAAPRLVRVMGA